MKLTNILITASIICSQANAGTLKDTENKVMKKVAAHEIHKEENKHAHKYFVEMDGALTKEDSIKASPSLKLGAFLYKDIYGYVENTWKDKGLLDHRKMGYKFGAGWVKEVKGVIPFAEINYTQSGKYKHGTWKDNLGYDFGVKYDVQGKYLPFIKIDDLFDNQKSDAKAGVQYRINDRLSASADLTVYNHNTEKSTDVAIVYGF